MAKSRDDIKYGTSQARLSEDEALRVAYVHGTPLEGGKIADSEPVNTFSSAQNISKASTDHSDSNQSHLQREDDADNGGSATDFTNGAPGLPKKGPPSNDRKT